jgi:hypothetical protein
MLAKRVPFALISLALVASGCGGGTSATLSITSPEEGADLGGNVVSLALDASGIDIVPADGDTSGTTGHFHVFVDREPVAAGEEVARTAGIVHAATNPVQITGLSPGEHTFTVVYGDGAHHRIGDTEASVTVTTTGPSIKVDAAVHGSDIAVAANPVDLEIEVKPPSDEHLHYFFDVTPTLDGTPIPTDDPNITHSREVSLTYEDVAAGEHTIWVVVAGADHVPLDPLVMDTAKVTVE